MLLPQISLELFDPSFGEAGRYLAHLSLPLAGSFNVDVTKWVTGSICLAESCDGSKAFCVDGDDGLYGCSEPQGAAAGCGGGAASM